MRKKNRKRWRRVLLVLLAVFLLLAWFLGKPAVLWTKAWWLDRPVVETLPPGQADDASRLNRTMVAEVWSIPSDPAAAEEQLRALLRRAREARLPVAIAGARHSMGGHTIAPGGIVLNMLPFNRLAWNPQMQLLTVGAGARWSEIVPYLDARGLSVAVMQSNNDFSVGGSLSVNCHGWQHNRAPIAGTVEALRVMKPDGTIVRCSRTENAELFSLVLGGYGLFGIILDAELRVVPNERYRPVITIFPADQYAVRYAQTVTSDEHVGMAYGRLCVVPGENTFLREAVLTTFRRDPSPTGELPALISPGYAALRRQVYRAQIGSDAGKEVRWNTEKQVSEQVARRRFSRNQLLHEPSVVYREQNADRTDILHEYFIPPAQVAAFLEKARAIIPRHGLDLLNVTVRHVREDKDTFLRYADQEMFAFVMLFNQERTVEADHHMETLTRELIDAALACGGRYYLPYRLHATPEQFHRAYPQADAFFTHKRRYDPDGLFQNQFYTKYHQP